MGLPRHFLYLSREAVDALEGLFVRMARTAEPRLDPEEFWDAAEEVDDGRERGIDALERMISRVEEESGAEVDDRLLRKMLSGWAEDGADEDILVLYDLRDDLPNGTDPSWIPQGVWDEWADRILGGKDIRVPSGLREALQAYLHTSNRVGMGHNPDSDYVLEAFADEFKLELPRHATVADAIGELMDTAGW